MDDGPLTGFQLVVAVLAIIGIVLIISILGSLPILLGWKAIHGFLGLRSITLIEAWGASCASNVILMLFKKLFPQPEVA